MPRPWRLLPTVTAGAARQMAMDEAIFRAYAEGRVPPTLRFYTWAPPGVSCGRFQRVDREVDLAACAALGYDVVRRPTGGRAVLHLDDLTYAVVLGERDGLPAGVLPAYLHLSRGLLAGLHALGIPAALHTPAGRAEGTGNPACFASPSWHELTVAGRKVAGSAQRREGPDILQHGSVILRHHPEALSRILRFPGPAEEFAARLARAAAGLREFCPDLEIDPLAQALAGGFAAALGVHLEPGELTGYEEELVAAFTPRYAGERFDRGGE